MGDNGTSISKDDDHKAEEELRNEIAELEDRLCKAKQRLAKPSGSPSEQPPYSSITATTFTTFTTSSSRNRNNTNPLRQDASLTTQSQPPPRPSPPPAPLSHNHDQHHNLLLLADSALPLGSFAFSSGFESYRAHMRAASSSPPTPSYSHSHSHSHSQSSSSWSFEADFLPLSVSSFAATSLPFMLAGYREVGSGGAARLAELDDACDAATVCAVARRASVAQGRALLGVWEKSFAPTDADGGGDDGPARALREFAALVRLSSSSASSSMSTSSAAAARRKAAAVAGGAAGARAGIVDMNDDDEEEEDGEEEPLPPAASAHFAPLFGAVARAMMEPPSPSPSPSSPDPTTIAQQQAAYAFILGHARAVTSAAMRAGVLGPFKAQRILAGPGVRRLIAAAVAREWGTPVEKAGQTAPALDLWVGRHEILYSKIFNS